MPNETPSKDGQDRAVAALDTAEDLDAEWLRAVCIRLLDGAEADRVLIREWRERAYARRREAHIWKGCAFAQLCFQSVAVLAGWLS